MSELNNTNKVRIKPMLLSAAGFITYTVGAGFSSGNELIQFFGSWGAPDFGAAIASSMILNILFCVFLFKIGSMVSFEKSIDAYTFVSGKVIGKIFEIFVTIFVLGVYMMMFAGAGGLLNQFWGWPVWVGSVIMGICASAIVFPGLKFIHKVFGYVGFILLGYLIIFGIVNLFWSGSSWEQGAAITQYVADGRVIQSNLWERVPISWIPGLSVLHSPIANGLLYTGICVIVGFPFYMTLGRLSRNRIESTGSGIAVGVSLYALVFGSIGIILQNFESIINPETGRMFPFPTLSGISAISPEAGQLYVVFIFIAILTNVAGYSWVITDWAFPNQERTPKIAILMLIMLLIGTFLGAIIPFSLIIFYMFPVGGLFGVILAIFTIVKGIRLKETPADGSSQTTPAEAE